MPATAQSQGQFDQEWSFTSLHQLFNHLSHAGMSGQRSSFQQRDIPQALGHHDLVTDTTKRENTANHDTGEVSIMRMNDEDIDMMLKSSTPRQYAIISERLAQSAQSRQHYRVTCMMYDYSRICYDTPGRDIDHGVAT